MTRKHFLRALAALSIGLAAAGAGADDVHHRGMHIGEPWARATTAGQTTGGGYLTLHNMGERADRLVSARSPAAERVELHTMTMEGDVMRMRQIDGIDLPAGKALELKPGGMHLMLLGLKAPLKAGSRVPLTLKFERAGEVRVELQVGQPAAAATTEHKH
jgi:copper(I)-binding protein